MKKSKYSRESRRFFLKSSVSGIAGLLVGSAGVGKIPAKTATWQGNTQINPDIDNLRVAFITDSGMILQSPSSWNTAGQNDAVNTSQVHGNMDKMACALAQKSSPAQAWAAIFMKQAGKSWQDVRVAIKTNCINSQNFPRLAIVDKICLELINLGVVPANITVFDASQNCTGLYGTTYSRAKLPANVNVSNSLGTRKSVTIVGGYTFQCVGDLVDGNIDILVNTAVNKGHGGTYGSCTLTMKNHTGTIKFSCPSFNEMISQNKSEPILGTQDLQAGLPYRQQLCIVDSLWSSVGGPGGIQSHQPAAILMGTFGPAVDYLTVKKIREPIMSASHNTTNVHKFITEFGYTDQERANLTAKTPEENNGRGWVDAASWLPTAIKGGSQRNFNSLSERLVELRVRSISGQNTHVRLYLPLKEKIRNAGIYDLNGRLVKKLSFVNADVSAQVLQWDGNAKSGSSAALGMYVVKIKGTNSTISNRFILR
ncbi:MAG: FlgD immunoglobulin-like domain containing protein [bacterium]